jgi:release factor glutamine methyltransferase
MSVSIIQAHAAGAMRLEENGISASRFEAGALLAHTLSRDRTYIVRHRDDPVSPEQMETFRSFIERRSTGEPLQYITGHQEFFKLDFEVNSGVLIPRPETELLVESALELLKHKTAPYFADIGTGSGCIAVSLLHELPNARGLATDISSAALQVARSNAEHNSVSDRLRLIESNAFAAIEATELFDLVASNPPYVSDEDMKSLQREVRREPLAALAGGADGFSVIRRLLRDAPMFLQTRGHFVFEIGFGQSEMVKGLIDAGVWELIEIREDLQGIPRAVVLRRN